MQDEPTRSDFRLGDWLVQPALCRLSKDGRTVQVRAKVMDLLTYLADHAGQVISKDRLLDDVWGSLAVSESALTRTVTELRQALEDDADRPHLLETIAKRGYRLIGGVTRVAPSPPAALELGTPPPEGPPAVAGATGVSVVGPTPDATHSAWYAWRPTWLLALAGAALGGAVIVSLSGGTPAPGSSAGTAQARVEVNEPGAGWSRDTGPLPLTRVSLTAPESVSRLEGVRLSPDGRRLWFTGLTADGSYRPFLQDLSQPQARRVEQCLDGRPRSGSSWSPDGREVVFGTRDALVTCDVETGVIRQVAQTSLVPFSSWSPKGVILLDSGASAGPLFRVDARGGVLRPETRLDTESGEIGHAFPAFLPDGERYLLVLYHRNPDVAGLYLGRLGSPVRSRLSAVTTPAVHVAGHVLWARQDEVIAQPLDERGERLTGRSIGLVQGYEVMLYDRHLMFSVSRTGDVALPVNPVGLQRFVWRARSGSRLQDIGEPGVYEGFSLSRDASQLVVSRRSPRVDDFGLWRVDLRRNLTSPWAVGGARLMDPRWAPDGTRVAASSMDSSAGQQRQVIVLVGPDGRSERLLDSGAERAAAPDDWTPDGRGLVYHVDGKAELRLLPIGTGASPSVLARAAGPVAPARAVVSPDGRFIAYQQFTGERVDVWVDTFPQSTARVQVSLAGGVQPRWRGDGGELYFLALDGSLQVASMARGPVPRPGPPKALFATGLSPAVVQQQYAPAPDGSRFLMLEPIPTTERPRIDLVLNGANLLRQ